MKAYSAKSSAVRAAKKAFGAEWESKASVLPDAEGAGWLVLPLIPSPPKGGEAKAENAAPLYMLARRNEHKHARAPWEQIRTAAIPQAEVVIEKLEALVERIESLPAMQVVPDDGHITGAGDGTANRLALGWKLSSIAKPTKLVWVIADSMPGASRKEVIEACIARGIAPGTSRTQYQAWFSAHKAQGTPQR